MWVSFKDILNYAVPATPVAPRGPMTMTTTTIGLETNDDNVDVEEEDKENVCGDIKEGTKDTPRKGWRVINEEKVSGAEPVKRILLQAEKVALPEIHDTRHLSLSLSLSVTHSHILCFFHIHAAHDESRARSGCQVGIGETRRAVEGESRMGCQVGREDDG